MNRRVMWVGILLVIASLLLGGSIWVAQAQSGQPDGTLAGEPGVELSPAVNLGQPGLSYRYVKSLGYLAQPYFSDHTHFFVPYGLAASGDMIWIGELFGERVQRFSSNGTFLGPEIGSAGYSEYQGQSVSCSTDISIDSGGNAWIASTCANYVIVFDSSGNYIKKLGQQWGYGMDNEHFGYPSGIAFDTKGNVYVADGALSWTWGNHRIQIFDNSGAYLKTIGETGVAGSDNNHFSNPIHIAIDDQDRLYVADRDNHRVQVFDVTNPTTPTYIATIGVTGASGSDNNHLNGPQGVTVYGNFIFVADSWNSRVQIFNKDTRAYFATLGGGGGSGNYQFSEPTDVAVDASGNIYVADAWNHRIQQYNSSRIYVRTYGVTGVPYLTDAYHFNHPTSLAVTQDDGILVLEDKGQRLIKLDSSGTALWTVGQPGIGGSDNAHFAWPQAVTVDSNGNIYVSDKDNHRIQKFNSYGTYITTIGGGTWGTGQYQFNQPHGITVAPDGTIYVADRYNHRVQVFNSSRIYVATMGVTGISGADNSHFNEPVDVALDKLGNIYVSDSVNHRIQVFNSARVYQRTIGQAGISGDNFGQFGEGPRLAIDDQNRLFASADNNIQIFDSSGAFLTSIGGYWDAGSLKLHLPGRGAVDKEGNYYTGEIVNARIQVFAPGVPGWKQMNINGFGDRWAQTAAMEVFNGQLYAGTANWTNESLIYRSGDNQTWNQVKALGVTGAVLDMTIFNGQLYASTGWGVDNISARIYRTSEGTTWEEVASGGFGIIENTSMDNLAVFQNNLYVAISNNVTGASIWRSDTGNAGSWSAVLTNGNGEAKNSLISSMAEFNGYLYAGVLNDVSGTRIWRTSNGTSWSQVNVDGFGDATNTETITMAVYKGNLYLGVNNTANSHQIWRTSNGTSWSKVLANGFGDPKRSWLIGFHVFGDRLFATSANESNTGIEVWETVDGINWSQANIDGFGDSNNGWSLRGNASATFENSLFIGLFNDVNGGEVWQMLKQVHLPLITKNYQSSTISQWRVVSSPTTKDLNSVFMVSANDGWAVGNDGTILRWNGSQWSNFSSPTTNHLQAVIIISPSDGWVVGNGGKILRWNGSAWNPVSSPTSNDLYDVKMITSNNGWAVGNGGVTLHWDGAAWSQVVSPTNRDLRALDFINASDGWAVGGMWDPNINWYQKEVLHWNGVNWTVDPGVNIQPDVIEAVDFISSTDGWIAGGNNLLNRRIGNNWTQVAGQPSMAWRNSLDQLSANEVWFVGWVYSKENINRWYQNAWTIFTVPTATNVELYGIDMLSSNEGWAVGQNGTILNYSP